ncbi:MAG TPA: hypothetical protein DCR93_38700 [Cytophagales bacterium]|nr:hypothetical protein [Cytophagales bacterium]HAP65166.1 hypothetical protein [Cytophagales bacterium]
MKRCWIGWVVMLISTAAYGQKDSTEKIEYSGLGPYASPYRYQDLAMSPLQYRGWMGGLEWSYPTFKARTIDQTDVRLGFGQASPSLPAFNLGNNSYNWLIEVDYSLVWKVLPVSRGHLWFGGISQTVVHGKFHNGLQNTFLFWDVFGVTGPMAEFSYPVTFKETTFPLRSRLLIPILGVGFEHNFNSLYDVHVSEFVGEIMRNPNFIHPGNFTRFRWNTQISAPITNGNRLTLGYSLDFFSTRYADFPTRFANQQISLLFDTRL